ncbi:hypothetical protein [Planctomycetes bacterium CA13]|uniref:hypothetical protein n=1 Tax=Novipirellula herctigrandis TaxID=2527986 RepID=UPI0011B5079C
MQRRPRVDVVEVESRSRGPAEPYRSVFETRGVLMSPVTMLASDNDIAGKYEPIQEFTIHK